jgi:hypothetical protein
LEELEDSKANALKKLALSAKSKSRKINWLGVSSSFSFRSQGLTFWGKAKRFLQLAYFSQLHF